MSRKLFPRARGARVRQAPRRAPPPEDPPPHAGAARDQASSDRGPTAVAHDTRAGASSEAPEPACRRAPAGTSERRARGRKCRPAQTCRFTRRVYSNLFYLHLLRCPSRLRTSSNRCSSSRARRSMTWFGGFACGRSLFPERTPHDQGDPLDAADGAIVADTNADYKHVDQARVLPPAL
jgi:hypothetical protein